MTSARLGRQQDEESIFRLSASIHKSAKLCKNLAKME